MRNLFNAWLAALAAGAMTLAACTEVDDTLGFDLVPDNQQMTILRKQIDTGFESSLYQTDSIVSSGLTNGYFGSTKDDAFGERRAGFLSQFVWERTSDRATWYGHRPIFDSLQLLLTITDFKGDTLQKQTFEVFEILSNDYLEKNTHGEADGEADTTFYIDFSPVEEGVIDPATPLFEFDFPDGTTTGPSTAAVTLRPTDAGISYARRLMLAEGKYEGDTTIYANDSLWVRYFRGLAIRPKSFAGEGAMFATDLSTSGLMLYGRSRDSVDQTLIKDTVQTLFYFYDQYAPVGNVSVNWVERTDGTKFSYATVNETQPDRPKVKIGYVEGMGGVVMELKVTDALLREIGELQTDTKYSTAAVNQALMYIYVDGVTDEGWEQDFGPSVIDWFDASPQRLGLYTDYKRLTPILDYAYAYEAQYSTSLPYGGYLNRSQGCYVLNISSYVQQLWKIYQRHKDEPEGQKQYTDDEKKQLTLYLAPSAYQLYTFSHTALQGWNGEPLPEESTEAPIRLEVVYTLIR